MYQHTLGNTPKHRRSNPVWLCFPCVFGLASGVGCSNDSNASGVGFPPPAPTDIPQSVSVSRATVTLGHAPGVLRKPAEVKAFKITKSPVTNWQFRKCVAVGACPKPEVQAETPNNWTLTYNESTDYDELPIAGVSAEQAKAYCAWVSGALPTFAQWQLATRGESMRHFPWGDSPSACDQYHTSPVTGQREASCDPLQVKVGKHSAGASPSGVEDVFMTPNGEIVRSDKNGLGVFSCPSGSGCVVIPQVPGIPTSGALLVAGKGGLAGVGFRCVWEG